MEGLLLFGVVVAAIIYLEIQLRPIRVRLDKFHREIEEDIARSEREAHAPSRGTLSPRE